MTSDRLRDFFASTSGLAHRPTDTPQAMSELATLELARGDQLVADDFDHLCVILYGLGVYHASFKQGWGNITPESLRRSATHQLVLLGDLALQSPSICEQTAINSEAARFFVNAAGKPKPVDDLVSLGVVCAELLIAKQDLPPTAPPDPRNYRRELLSLLSKEGQRQPQLKNMLRLVKALVAAKESGADTTPKFLRKHVGLWQLAPNIRPASAWHVARQFAWTIATVSIVCLLAGGWILSLAAQYRRSAQELARNADSLKNQLADIASQNASLTAENQQLQERPTPTAQTPKAEPNSIAQDARFQKFKNDPNLRQNKRLTQIVRQATVTTEDVNYASEALNELEAASKIWWQLIGQDRDEQAILTRFAMEKASIKEALNTWYKISSEPRTYEVKVKQLTVPPYSVKYKQKVSIYDVRENAYRAIMQTATETNVPPFEGSMVVSWRAGQTLQFYVESLEYFGSTWTNKIAQSASGALSMHRLVSTVWRENDYAVEFSVDNLPGPPLEVQNDILTSPALPLP